MNTTGSFLEAKQFVPDVARMDQLHFPQPWKEQDWRDLDFNQHRLYLWQGPELRGYALIGLVPWDDTAHLYKILLAPEYRGTGEAGEFWKHITQALSALAVQSVYLEVEVENKPAQGFYEKAGFEQLRRVKGFYSGGQDAFIYALTL